ncbi:hypothetical protein [Stigmatella aurantiaca]|uniref:Conserved uncharacterized protein n=1 Tax=Stigmatella aurantiaca (strain DW4/3-1) TaxID=378806 RepID=Q097D9_STIAD|nr:hypothetical protein [Stigmatella aurantiaca]ADO76093.1 conserved uncharacterized protein [Stigmatella aurantiaca DW4/3-1]EAU67835.1 hypothetical protein STIAU_3070 [Stigmatella aurantiaca DW4/3-1]
MRALGHSLGWAAVLALAVPAAGCQCGQKAAESPRPTAPVEGHGERPAAAKAGVKVPLPPGWSAIMAEDGSFQAGPPGQPVLRVDIRRGEGEKRPSSEALMASVREQFSQFEISLDQEEDEENLALLRLTIAPKLADGGVGMHAPTMLGAKRVGEDLFLCASLPGAETEEVRLSTEACREIQIQGAAR